jgi:NAD(P)H-hydrate repair Nnr-like enzyme with NAD(P)H-hydrate dehydratase domain
VRAFAARSGAIVVCKSSTTLIAHPDGRFERRGLPNALLATGGTGDVLAGVIGALLASGLDPYEAALLGVSWHSAAGLRLALRLGDAGLLASELADELPLLRREARAQ